MTLVVLLACSKELPFEHDVPVWPTVGPAPALGPAEVTDAFALVGRSAVDVVVFVADPCPGPDAGPAVAPMVEAALPWLDELLADDDLQTTVEAVESADCATAPMFDAIEGGLEALVRPDAAVHVLIASPLADGSALTAADLAGWLSARWPGATLSAVADPALGAAWFDAAALLGGGAWPLDVAGWPAVFEEMAALVAQPTPDELFLTERPADDTVEVTITSDGIALALDAEHFGYDPARNSVALQWFAPAHPSTVEVQYVPAR